MASRGPETSLYATVKAFLEAQGFAVKGEVCGCDIVAVRGAEPPLVVICELKLTLSLELLLQGVERLRAADEVWLAVTATRRGRDRDRRAHRLCRMLGFGLLAVTAAKGRVEVLVEPGPWRPRPNLPQRRRLLKEHTARRGDPTAGGSTRRPIMTAYRQQALDCAAALRHGPLRPRDLRPMAPEAAGILRRNVYGRFQRVRHGLYRLAEPGEIALRFWDHDAHTGTGQMHASSMDADQTDAGLMGAGQMDAGSMDAGHPGVGTGGGNSNPHGISPTDFRATSAFAARPPTRPVRGLDHPFALACGLRRCPSGLYTFPLPGLARDCHSTGFPEFEQFYRLGFPKGTQVGLSPLRLPFPPRPRCAPCIANRPPCANSHRDALPGQRRLRLCRIVVLRRVFGSLLRWRHTAVANGFDRLAVRVRRHQGAARPPAPGRRPC